MIVDLITWLAAKGIVSNETLRPTPLSRDDKVRAAVRSRRLAEEKARRQRTLPVRMSGAGVVIHSRFRSSPHV